MKLDVSFSIDLSTKSLSHCDPNLAGSKYFQFPQIYKSIIQKIGLKFQRFQKRDPCVHTYGFGAVPDYMMEFCETSQNCIPLISDDHLRGHEGAVQVIS